MEFDGHGFTVMPGGGGWTWGLELTKYGFTGHEREVEGKAESSPSSQRLEYRRDQSLTEWFVNDQRGMEQGWTFQKRPATEGKPRGVIRVRFKHFGEVGGGIFQQHHIVLGNPDFLTFLHQLELAFFLTNNRILQR